MKKTQGNGWQQALFYGSIWGILEATVGYVLHLLPTLISGAIMFPIATLIMGMAYKETGSRKVVLNMAFIASAIKLVNFLMPGIYYLKVINPAIAILIEGAVVALALPVIFGKKTWQFPLALVGTSLAWRGIFVGTVFVETLVLTMKTPGYLSSFSALAQFVVVNGLVSAVIGLVFLFALRMKTSYNLREKSPVLSGALCVVALVLTFILR